MRDMTLVTARRAGTLRYSLASECSNNLTMLPGMDAAHLEALALLRASIRKLWPPGPVRERWLAWAATLVAVPDPAARRGLTGDDNSTILE